MPGPLVSRQLSRLLSVLRIEEAWPRAINAEDGGSASRTDMLIGNASVHF